MRTAIPLTQEEVDRLFKYLKEERKDSHRERDACIFTFGLKTGLRVGTLSLLTWDIILNEKLEIRDDFFIDRKLLKGKKKALYVFKNPALWDAIRVHFSKNFTKRKDRVFLTDKGEPFTSVNLRVWIWRRLREAGMERSAHSLRKKAGTDYNKVSTKEGGGLNDTRQFLGHTTMRHTIRYLETNYDRMRAVAMAI